MSKRDFFRKTQHKRYISKSFENPYFRNREKGHKTAIVAAVAIFLILFGSVLSFLFFHPMFFIQNIHVSGLEKIEPDQIEEALISFSNQKLFLIFSRQNRFLFNQKKLKEFLNEQFTFQQIDIDKAGTSISINLTERTSNLIWKTGEKKFIVDLEGVIIREAGGGEDLPVFVDLNDIETTIGSVISTPNEISSVFRFHDHLRLQNISFVQTEFDRLAGKWTGILTTDGYRILFDPTGDIDLQAQRLDTLRRDKISDFTKLEYIDLRFGDHVYYK